ncbi:hypothetical protein CCDG5_0783 [[Clostridium] cellulosi]|uniref:Uncharacterized protein n=1 Tax=[Clostridium] cellulosi TaxID=29343 RepID=A0A078KN27_9FIRM|nr:hypothetical protein CCDG5_0783 [[Clostridium] cellulosi]
MRKNRNSNIKMLLVVLAGIVVFIVVLLILTHNYKSDPNWLSFLGSYIGSFIGAAATFIAFYFTYKENQMESKRILEHIKEQERVSIQPFLTTYYNSNQAIFNEAKIEVDKDSIVGANQTIGKSIRKQMWIKNIGQASAIDVDVAYPGSEFRKNLGNIQKDEFFLLNIDIPYSIEKYNFSLWFFIRSWGTIFIVKKLY